MRPEYWNNITVKRLNEPPHKHIKFHLIIWILFTLFHHYIIISVEKSLSKRNKETKKSKTKEDGQMVLSYFRLVLLLLACSSFLLLIITTNTHDDQSFRCFVSMNLVCHIRCWSTYNFYYQRKEFSCAWCEWRKKK